MMSMEAAFLTPASLKGGSRQQFLNSPRLSSTFSCAVTPAATSPAKDCSLPPSTVSTAGVLPASLYNTTILHNIPSFAPHLDGTLAHPLDGDGYILALSFQSSGTVWPRSRFVRTKAFMAESNAGRRLYRGTHGTAGATGWQAPLKPKPAAAAGAFIWGYGKKRRAFAFGTGALPIALDIASLVARGPTALGAVLTDSQELASQRATELPVAPMRLGASLFVLGLSRSPTGKVLGSYVVEIDQDYKVKKRLPRVNIPARCVVASFSVAGRFCALLLHKEKNSSDAGFLGTLFKKNNESRASPILDKNYGSLLILIPMDGTASSSLRIPGACTAIAGLDDSASGSLRLSLLSAVEGDEEPQSLPTIRRSTLADLKSGQYWVQEEEAAKGLRVRMLNIVVDLSAGTTMTVTTEFVSIQTAEKSPFKDVSLLCTAQSTSKDGSVLKRKVFTMFDHEVQRVGLISMDLTGFAPSVISLWTAEHSNYRLSGPVLSEDDEYVSVLATGEEGAGLMSRVLVFDVGKMEQGPVHETTLDAGHFGQIDCSVGGVWEKEGVDWGVEGNKPAKSSYEIFDSRKWNDIESGFSSLGLGQ